MPTSPSLPAVHLPAAPTPADQGLHVANMVFLRFLPRPFVEFLDKKLGKLIESNGGFGNIGFDVKRGQPGMLMCSETHKEDAWTSSPDNKESA